MPWRPPHCKQALVEELAAVVDVTLFVLTTLKAGAILWAISKLSPVKRMVRNPILRRASTA